MENASKALLMAGGILIALLIIVKLVYSFGVMGGYFDTENSKQQAEQLKIFNEQYEAYNRKLLRGVDVISVINKVLDNNQKYGPDEYDEPNYLMQIEFEMLEGAVYQKDKQSGKNQKVDSVTFKTGINYNQNSISEIKQSSEAFNDLKRRIFDCVEVRYHKETGRVNYIKFIERKIDYTQDY